MIYQYVIPCPTSDRFIQICRKTTTRISQLKITKIVIDVGLIIKRRAFNEVMPKTNISTITRIIDAMVETGFLKIISRKARTIGIIMKGTTRNLRLVA